MWFQSVSSDKQQMVRAEDACPGRAQPLWEPKPHAVSGRSLIPPYPAGARVLDVGMGCFWGAERLFWEVPGVYVTAVGYAGGFTPNPTYEEVCSGKTGHTEVVRVVYDPAQLTLNELLKLFWESHDPTQGMRQGNDRGTQYRSALYLPDAESLEVARSSRDSYDNLLRRSGKGAITTEILMAGPFYLAEDYHQQYLYKNPNGYCGLRGTGIACPL